MSQNGGILTKNQLRDSVPRCIVRRCRGVEGWRRARSKRSAPASGEGRGLRGWGFDIPWWSLVPRHPSAKIEHTSASNTYWSPPTSAPTPVPSFQLTGRVHPTFRLNPRHTLQPTHLTIFPSPESPSHLPPLQNRLHSCFKYSLRISRLFLSC